MTKEMIKAILDKTLNYILEENKEGDDVAIIVGLDQAAAEIMELGETQMIGFQQWTFDNFCQTKDGYMVWLESTLFYEIRNKTYTTSELLTLYKQKTA
jgi:hypothetical protein